MKVRYVGPFDAVDVAGHLNVQRGATIDVADEIAAALCEQSDVWQAVKTTKAAKDEEAQP